MEDGPEEANGRYEYNGRTYTLEERDSHQWRVLDGETLLGTLIGLPPAESTGVLYFAEGVDGPTVADGTTDDWRRAIETLIDQAGI